MHKNRVDNCFVYEKYCNFFTTLKLPFVDFECLGEFTDFKVLNDALIKKYKEVHFGDIDTYKEGVVVYMENKY